MSIRNIIEESKFGQLFILENAETAIEHALFEGIKKRIQELEKSGVQKGHKIVLCMGNSAVFCETLFAVWSIGACAIPISSTSTDNEVKAVAELTEAFQVIYDNGNDPWLRSENRESLDGDFLILHTSGSSGTPKGVCLSEEAVLNKIKIIQSNLSMDDFERTLCVLPLNFGHGLLLNFLTPLMTGKSVYLAPNSRMDIYSQLGTIVDKFKITTFSSVPSILKIAANFSERPAGHSLKKIFCASAALDKETWQRTIEWSSGIPFCNMYGLTELASWIAGSEASSLTFEENVFNLPWEAEIKIIKNEESDEYGEIYLKSVSMMSGYFRNTEATKKALYDGWFKTGDLGMIQNKKIHLKGRIDDVINLSGVKIYPQEINQEIRKHESVADCFTFGLKTGGLQGDYTIACVLIAVDGAVLNSEDVRAFCRKNLSLYKIPSQYKVLDKFPLTQRGKIDSGALKKLFTADTGNN